MIPKPWKALRLLAPLKQGSLGSRHAENGQLSPQMAMLRTWQAERLSRTHADLLNDSRYRLASQFFLSDIYAPQDFTQRDQDIEHIYAAMDTVMPPLMRHTLEKVVELNGLTAVLDQSLLRSLINDLGVVKTLAPPLYAQAYRLCDNYDDRARQITLIVQIGEGVDRLTRLPFINMALRMARIPAHWSGWDETQGFFERGFAAFKNMDDVDIFLETIERREQRILDAIFSGSDNPFQQS